MLYAGAVAAGAFPDSQVTLFGVDDRVDRVGLRRDVARRRPRVLARLAARLGNRALRRPPLVLRYGRFVHLDEDKVDHAEASFDRRGDAAVFWARNVPVVRSFISIPAGVFEMRFAPTRCTACSDLCRGRSASRRPVSRWATAGTRPQQLPLGRLRRGRVDRRRHRLPDRPYRAPEGPAPCGACGRTGWERRAGVDWPLVGIPLVDVPAQYAPLLGELRGPDHGGHLLRAADSGPERGGLRARNSCLPRCAGGDRGGERNRRARAGPRGPRNRPRRRGHLPVLYVLRDGRGDRAGRRDPRVLRHRSLDAEPRSRDVARRVTGATKAILAVHLFGRPAPIQDLPGRNPGDRGHGTGFRGGAPWTPGRNLRRGRNLQLLPDEEPPRLGDGGLVVTADPALRRPDPPVALPRIARQADLRGPGLQLAPRRAPGGRAAGVPSARRHVEPVTRRGAAARYSALGLGQVCELPPDDPGHVYHMYVVR